MQKGRIRIDNKEDNQSVDELEINHRLKKLKDGYGKLRELCMKLDMNITYLSESLTLFSRKFLYSHKGTERIAPQRKWARRGLNPRLLAYQASALTRLSHGPN